MKVQWDEVEAKQKSENHSMRELEFSSFYLTRHEYEAGWFDENHQHPEMQFSYVLEGSMSVFIKGGDVIEQGQGQSIFIQSMAMHRSTAPTTRTVALNLYMKNIVPLSS